MGLAVSQSPSSACAHMPRLFHYPDCCTVSTCCTYIDLGSRWYFDVNVALVCGGVNDTKGIWQCWAMHHYHMRTLLCISMSHQRCLACCWGWAVLVGTFGVCMGGCTGLSWGLVVSWASPSVVEWLSWLSITSRHGSHNVTWALIQYKDVILPV